MNTVLGILVPATRLLIQGVAANVVEYAKSLDFVLDPAEVANVLIIAAVLTVIMCGLLAVRLFVTLLVGNLKWLYFLSRFAIGLAAVVLTTLYPQALPSLLFVGFFFGPMLVG